MDRLDPARIFNEIGVLLELKGENPFKTRAYYNAARSIQNLREDLEALIREDRLKEVPGFGEAIVRKILEWYNTGTIEYHENLKNTTPPGLLDLLRVPGLGPKKINVLFSSLGISNLEMLEEACNRNGLLNLPGFGVKTQEKICAGLRFIKEQRGSFLWVEGIEWALKLRKELAEHPGVNRIEIAGSLRRYKPVIKDIDLVAASTEPHVVMDHLTGLSMVEQITGRGETKSTALLKSGIGVDLRVVKPEEFPHALQHFTGSKDHNTALRHLAKRLGYKVNEYGLFKGEEAIYCRDEAEIYRYLGLDYILPELREDLGEIEGAGVGSLPKPVQAEDIQGLFHIHTSYSDGVSSLREMVEAAIDRGYKYLGISDHSQIAVYAHGLTKDTLKKQFAEIDQLNDEYPGFKIFKGIEADILPSGELDYDLKTLEGFDFVIGSVHSHFRMGKMEMTKRILKAMDNPYLTMLGHPTGRILLGRPAYEVDLDAIIAKAAENGVIIEFNANPYRLDLDWRWCRKAKKHGVQIAINPDAHSTREIDLTCSGISVAGKGWLEKADVFNTKSVQEIGGYLKGLKGRSAPS